MIGCGPGNSCCGHCASQQPARYSVNLGDAEIVQPADVSVSAPETTKVIYDYAVNMLRLGRPFHISKELNSDIFQVENMGFFPALFAAAASIGTKIAVVAPKVASVVATANALKGSSGGGGSGVTSEDIAATVAPEVQKILAQQGVNLPNAVANQAVSASLLDSFGSQNRPYVMAGIAGLGLLVLLKLLRR